jgi:hypothetical protein
MQLPGTCDAVQDKHQGVTPQAWCCTADGRLVGSATLYRFGGHLGMGEPNRGTQSAVL